MKKFVCKIHNQRWTIMECDDGENVYSNRPVPGRDGEYSTRMGDTDFFSQTVYILTHLSTEAKRETLGHELTHVFLYAYAIPKVTCEEDICNFIGCYGEEIQNLVNAYFEMQQEGTLYEGDKASNRQSDMDGDRVSR